MSMASAGTVRAKSGHFSPGSMLNSAPQTSDVSPAVKETLVKIADTATGHFDKAFGEAITTSVTLVSVASETAASFLGSFDKTAVTGLFDVPGAKAEMIASLDYEFVQLYIELMCGGVCSEKTSDEPRAGTQIDRQFARSAFNLVARVFEEECAVYNFGEIAFNRIETKFDPLVLGPRQSSVAVVTFSLECRAAQANFRLALPGSVLERMKLDSLPAASVEGGSADPTWTEHFQSEIGRTNVKLDACLDADSLSLGEIAALKVGQTLLLPRMVSSRCELRSDRKLLFRCELGQTDGRYSVRISETAAEIAEGQAKSAAPSNIFE